MLPQVDDLGFGIVFGVEPERRVGQVLCFEIGYVENSPAFSCPHFHLCGLIAAIDGEPCTGGYYLRTTKPLPKIMDGNMPVVYPIDYYQGINISFVSRDRMRYVGSNPYLRSIIYASIGPDLHLYLNSNNSQFLYLKKLRMTAVFEDFEEATGLLCDEEGSSVACDVLDADFPIRDYLVPPLIELVVKELTGAVYKPEDVKNNAKDDLSQNK